MIADNNKSIGIFAEQEFVKLLNLHGVPYEYIDGWVDFMVYGVPVDVKSCLLSHKFTNKKVLTQSYKIGRFDFTLEQREKDLWVALFIRHSDNYLFLGVAQLNKNSPRYISIHKTREINLLSIPDFIKKIKGVNV